VAKILLLERFQHIIHTSNRIRALIKQGCFLFIQSKIEDFFPAIFPDNYRNAETNIFLSVIAFEKRSINDFFSSLIMLSTIAAPAAWVYQQKCRSMRGLRHPPYRPIHLVEFCSGIV
jgi:hypothetical protein